MSRSRFACALLGACTWLVLHPSRVTAQTDYFNTDGGRPLRIEDATAVEWRAIELQLAPFSLERHGGRWQPSLEPELAFGILPRTHLSVGFPLQRLERAGTDALTGLGGVHLSLFHQLNVETRIPAFAVRSEVLLPAGPLGAGRAIPSVTGIATRTLSGLGPVRVHANATVTLGDALAANDAAPDGAEANEIPRWLAGVSIDRAFPVQYTLVAAELLAQRGLADGSAVTWHAGVGVRHQLTARFVVDAGVRRRLTSNDAPWSITVGSAMALSLGRRLF
ncbi:MAG: hypothetical protein MUD17_05285 [Gemmatimonadaceae bacterium]|jgi:hypothetical protein|nr:hypothetical protein [Gemmatimonadaceae bacterium]